MGKRGFTLLEMIVATTIMGIAVVGTLSAISASVRNAARLRDYDRIVQLSRLRINELLVDQRMPRNLIINGPFDPAETGGIEAGWQARLTTFDRPAMVTPGQLTLDRIELQVWWMAGGQRRTFSLDAYRPHALKPEDLVPGAAR